MTGISKRRAGEVMGGAFVADPRPVVNGDKVVGARCAVCGYPTAPAAPWCPACQGRDQKAAEFGPGGTVWSSTQVQIPVGRWQPPYTVAYVDLDDGPRVLAHLPAPVRGGTRVRVVSGEEGNLLMEPEGLP